MMQLAGPSSPQFQPTHGLIDGPLPPRLLREACKFVKLVKEYKNREVYDRLLQILKDYVEQRIDVSGTASRIKQLVEHHSELRQGVKRLQHEVKVANFTAKVEGRLAMSDCIRYYVIIEGYRSRQKSMVKTIKEMAVLFANHRDLLLDFLGFLPCGFNLSD
ncbi:hypothetical protein FH972_019049 [Carpinus fangiana]|uniref:Uncharacterized protein n=1 Tax=Carpinus fangiana TaxID=176857 RepID=A0A5N6RS05_9ROSI|nr:hypothetical protein FH972_019049 [Carpinus fangiana]